MLTVEKRINDSTTVVAQGETQLDVFNQLASMQEVFGERECAKCGDPYIQYRTRKASKGKGKSAKEFYYPELVCTNPKCRAKLSYGQAEGGLIFPIRYERETNEDDVTVYVKDENGRNIPKGKWGWVIYNKETGKEE